MSTTRIYSSFWILIADLCSVSYSLFEAIIEKKRDLFVKIVKIVWFEDLIVLINYAEEIFISFEANNGPRSAKL